MDRNRPALSPPNLLTASRIAAAPLLAWAVLTAQSRLLAAGLVLAAALTDLLDGAIARSTGRVSELGAVLDPVADKIFILTALALLLAEGLLSGVNASAVLIILWRELLISGLRDYARSQGLPASVSPLAKAKAAAQFFAAILLFASRVPGRNAQALLDAGIGLLWAAAGLALYTGADYLWRAWRQSWK
jgi:CDP-diacylglycerol--glycerol-3-phosphate 3-phosphatidyltransferase